MIKGIRHFIAQGFGSGRLPWAPGTWGTVAAIPIYLGLILLPFWFYCVVVVLGFAVGIYLCGSTAKDLGLHDHPSIVWDEIIGYLITMLAVKPSWQAVIGGFVLFRFFDIVKPWPISYLDKNCPGGLGIMLDDVVAGIYAGLILWLIYYFVV